MTFKNWIHLCIDMQRMFAEDTPWHVPWMKEVLSQVEEVARWRPDRTVFTRFVPPKRASDMLGMWHDYYRKWDMMTLDRLGPSMVDLVPSLKVLVPPARIFDKMTYSPWTTGELDRVLRAEGIDAVAISGGETDVCVLAAAMGAIDLGYHVILLKDGVCSGADQTHDASLELLGDRFSVQLEILSTEAFLARA
ncbi:cysteine hydrolase family protein [Rhizobium rhizoryzae]|uniref:Nicotinamidase-related amidase n=1 Tax=Rhizobium rhizoryzae TaxID=451876 RepID=A0A7W6LHG9_9HYPH|nr:cysteine hydrolase [Rhizobium rhizoryzae]MBB4144469.1 nicotinamidase-related amidase [Rhizobium rhizoryzae]